MMSTIGSFWKPGTRGLTRIAVVFAAVSVAFVGGAVGTAHAFPDRPVTIIVPFSAGGTTDIAARAIAESLSQKWDHPVIIDNKPGAGNIIGLLEAKGARADGHTIVIAPDPALSINPLTYSALPYNVEEDFDPITVLVRFSLAIVVTDETPANSLSELAELARSETLTYGSFGPGTAPHLVLESFKNSANIDMQHIPYEGLAPVNLALQSGEVHASVMSVGAAQPLIESGDIRALAAESRTSLAPDVPTFSEAGFPDVRAPAWWAVLAPAGTPEDIIFKLNAAFNSAMGEPPFQSFVARGYEAGGDSPEETAQLIRETTEYWRPIVEAIGLELD